MAFEGKKRRFEHIYMLEEMKFCNTLKLGFNFVYGVSMEKMKMKIVKGTFGLGTIPFHRRNENEKMYIQKGIKVRV